MPQPNIIPLVSRNNLWGETWDTSRECWTFIRIHGSGKIHIGYVPWRISSACRQFWPTDVTRFVWEWQPFPKWGEAMLSGNWCSYCRKIPYRPWDELLPPGFDPPMTREECSVIADWWGDYDSAKEKIVRKWSIDG